MKLPRRVPWASIGELDQVCSWIFSDENNRHLKLLAVNRLLAWGAITFLPHALESTLALLTVILQDQDIGHRDSFSYLCLRQSYAAAVIRLVNGLVDPLQFGVYARSIASIAAQLGLPPWLVELRHAATHEELPSLELLREAARESMEWLLHNYFLPTLNPTSAPSSQPKPPRPLRPILKQYKSLLKLTTRDATLHKQYKAEITSVFRDIERWVAEAKVAANVAVSGLAWDVGTTMENARVGDEDIKERWAIEMLCDALLERGALVPVSKKKRVDPDNLTSLPESSVALWKPLIVHLQNLHPSFPYSLLKRIISHLLFDSFQFSGTPDSIPIGIDEVQRDDSFDICLARWAEWIIDIYGADDMESQFDLRREATVTLVTALGPGATDTSRNRKPALDLLQSLCASKAELKATVKSLLPANGAPLARGWGPEDIVVMDDRLNSLLALEESTTSLESRNTSEPPTEPSGPACDTIVAPGWRILGEKSGWRPSPIGAYVGGDIL